MGLVNKIKSIFKKDVEIKKDSVDNDIATILKATAESAKSIGMSFKEVSNAIESITFKNSVNKEYGKLIYLYERTKNKRIKKKLQKRIDQMLQ